MVQSPTQDAGVQMGGSLLEHCHFYSTEVQRLWLKPWSCCTSDCTNTQSISLSSCHTCTLTDTKEGKIGPSAVSSCTQAILPPVHSILQVSVNVIPETLPMFPVFLLLVPLQTRTAQLPPLCSQGTEKNKEPVTDQAIKLRSPPSPASPLTTAASRHCQSSCCRHA